MSILLTRTLSFHGSMTASLLKKDLYIDVDTPCNYCISSSMDLGPYSSGPLDRA